MKKLVSIFVALLVSASMVASVSAAGFTPSVTGKDAPTTATITTASGAEAAGIVYDQDGNEVGVMDLAALTVVPLSQAETEDSEVADRLKEAYKQIMEAENLSELTPDLEEILEKMELDINVEDLVVRDLFDITVDDEIMTLLEEGNELKVNFEVELAEDQPLLVLQFVDDEWTVLDPEKVEVNYDDDIASLMLNKVGTLAFVTTKQEGQTSLDAAENLFSTSENAD